MKDLDFDELDRAVNSLIGSPAAAPVASNDASATTPVVAGAPAAPATVVTPEPTVPAGAASEPQPLAARRSSGRFMDVVHPSSDMRVPIVPPRPSHEAATIQPTTESMPTPEPVAEPQESTTATPSAPAWPDPLDFHGFNDDTSKQDETPAAMPESARMQTDSTDGTLADDQLAPLESPFLTDAKVEKRPLGAFAGAPIEAPQLSINTPPAGEAASVNTDRPIETDTPLPEELQDNLLSIESNEDTASVATETAPLTPAFTPVAPSPAPDVQVSIPQQYIEQPSTGDKPAGSIFDVDSYHKPIAHPKKHKSGWMVALWITLLLILGVGAGAGFYFYILPML